MNQFPFGFSARPTRPLAITNVAVIPMDRPRLIRDQTVVIEDGWITAIAPASTIDTTNMITIAGQERYLLPGLADMHVHYWSPGDAALFLASGVTHVRNMSGAPFHLALQQQVEHYDLPGPNIFTTSPIIEGDVPTLPMWHRLKEPGEAAALVQQCVERGYQQIKVYNGLSLAALQALGRAASAAGLRVTGHCPNALTFEEAMAAGMTCFEHFVGIWRGHCEAGVVVPSAPNLVLEVLQCAASQIDFDAIRRLAHSMATLQVWNCPTLIGMQYMYEHQEKCLADPVLQPWLPYVPQCALANWAEADPRRYMTRPPYSYNQQTYDQWCAAMQVRNTTFARILSILRAEGAPLLIGTDTPVRFVIQGLSLHQELANFVAAGFSPYDAIRCATSQAARFLQQIDQSGTVEIGKRADLLLARANPLDDIRALRDLEGVCINGCYLSRSDLDGLLAQQAALAAQPPLHALPSTALGDPYSPSILIRSGSWIERVGERDQGVVSYRHSRLPDETWLIEECYAFEQGMIFSIGGGRRRMTQLYLHADFTICRATITEESFVGATCYEITISDTGRYTIQHIAEDGYVTNSILETPPLLPDVTVALTILPYVRQPTATTDLWRHAALQIDESGAKIVTAEFFAAAIAREAAQLSEQPWRVSVARNGEPPYSYEQAPDRAIACLKWGKRTFYHT